MFKVNNKDSRMTPRRCFGVFIINITASVPPISAGGIKKKQNKNKKKSAS